MTDKILVVDDELNVLELIRRFLMRAGYACTVASSAAQARELLEAEPYTMLLTDIEMPGESGLELTRFVKTAYPDMIVIFVSGCTDRDTAKATLENGAYAYLTKPIRINEMLLFVENGLHSRRLEIENRSYLNELEKKVKERTRELEEVVDELRKSRKAYQESEEKFRIAIEHSNDGVVMFGQGRILYVNAKCAQLFGFSGPEEIVGKDPFSIVHPDDRQRVMDINTRRILGKPAPERYEFKGLHRDRHPVDLELSVAQTRYQNIPVTLAFIRDITSQKADRKALEESEERLRKILGAVQAGILIIEKKSGTIIQANSSALRMIGAEQDEVIGKNCLSFIFSSDQLKNPLGDSRREAEKTEAILLTAEGREVHILKNAVPIMINGQDCLLESFVDISELKQTEQKLTEAYQELENLFAALSSILIRLTPSGRITRWNEQAAATFGLKESEVSGKSLFELPIQWDLEKLQEAVNESRMKQGPVRSREFRYQGLDGNKGLLGFTLSPLFDESGIFSGHLMVGADITERKNLESQLAQAQKLESIGQLAAGIAHEINTPIQYVGDNTRFFKEAFEGLSLVLEKYSRLMDGLKEDEDLTETVEEVARVLEETDLDFIQEEIPQAIEQTLQGVGQVGTIVRSMKEFSHPGGQEKILVDLNTALESTVTISRNEWKYVADLQTDFDDDLPMVPCLPAEMNQVFLNIIVNAAQAIGEAVGKEAVGKGLITISTRTLANEVEIRVKDTGTGIPAQNRPYVFDPFYTTKEVGKGTGQGLALAYKTVVDRHDGALSFESGETGTTFLIRLPVLKDFD
ncbi:MAG: PAS domain S-box protein [Desulfohalobiaceae bacterium]|nr:PAS domain S-box protein [Desulfohalobiaceae bacterium]